MHSIPRSVFRPVIPAMMALALLQAAHAIVIKVSAPTGKADETALRLAAAQLRESWQGVKPGTMPTSGTWNGWAYQIADGAVVPAAFSGRPATTSFIWSDQTVRFEQGFRFGAGKVSFGAPTAAAAAKPQAPPTKAGAENLATRLTTATLVGSSLRLEYSLAEAAPVTASLLDLNGKVLGRWTWKAEAGRSSRTLVAEKLPRNGMVLLRWTSGRHDATRRLPLTPR